jgi:hypothetical protein
MNSLVPVAMKSLKIMQRSLGLTISEFGGGK